MKNLQKVFDTGLNKKKNNKQKKKNKTTSEENQLKEKEIVDMCCCLIDLFRFGPWIIFLAIFVLLCFLCFLFENCWVCDKD